MVAGLMGAADVDHDSILSLAEITTLLLALGVAPGDEATFVTRLDTNDDSVVTLDELVEAFHDYFTSDEPGTIGNSILGPISASDSIR